jgi:hypothetical protein
MSRQIGATLIAGQLPERRRYVLLFVQYQSRKEAIARFANSIDQFSNAVKAGFPNEHECDRERQRDSEQHERQNDSRLNGWRPKMKYRDAQHLNSSSHQKRIHKGVEKRTDD